MKPTDYAPRATAFDLHIQPGTTGVEVGCDVGAHAEAILKYRQPGLLSVIDTWDNPWCEGYCFGRLREYPNVKLYKGESHNLSGRFGELDFVYIDITHDTETVLQSLKDWWGCLKVGGVMGYRNYSTCKETIDKWVKGKEFKVMDYYNEIIIWK